MLTPGRRSTGFAGVYGFSSVKEITGHLPPWLGRPLRVVEKWVVQRISRRVVRRFSGLSLVSSETFPSFERLMNDTSKMRRKPREILCWIFCSPYLFLYLRFLFSILLPNPPRRPLQLLGPGTVVIEMVLQMVLQLPGQDRTITVDIE